MKVTIYADNLLDAISASKRIAVTVVWNAEDCAITKDKPIISVGRYGFNCLIWGTPEHWQADCREQQDAIAILAQIDAGGVASGWLDIKDAPDYAGENGWRIGRWWRGGHDESWVWYATDAAKGLRKDNMIACGFTHYLPNLTPPARPV